MFVDEHNHSFRNMKHLPVLMARSNPKPSRGLLLDLSYPRVLASAEIMIVSNADAIYPVGSCG